MGKVDKVVTVVLDSLSADDLSQYADSLPTLKSAFDIVSYTQLKINPCPAEPGYTLPLQTV